MLFGGSLVVMICVILLEQFGFLWLGVLVCGLFGRVLFVWVYASLGVLCTSSLGFDAFAALVDLFYG